MTPVEIAYFKHFMFDKDLARSFIHLYKTRHINGGPSGDKQGNPESVEEYFMQTSVKDVIMKAFYFAPLNNNAQRLDHTFDYWKDIDDKWQAYMKDNASNFSNDSWPSLRKSFAILRQNWDAPGYWRRDNLESTEEVYKRMRIDLPMPDFQWEHGYMPKENRLDSNLINYDIHNAKDGDFVVRTRVLKNGAIGRTIFIIKEVVPYNPETSEFSPEELHRDYDPEKNNIHIAYLHARYTSNGESFSSDYEEIVHSIIDDNLETEKYRLAFKGEEQIMILKLAKHQLAWNPTTKKIVPLLDALKSGSEDAEQIDYSEEEDDPLADFDFIDDALPGNYRLKSNEISINFNNGYKITFNQIDSKVIRESGLKFARLAKSKTGDICLIINNQKGASITNISGRTKNMNATINSSDITVKLRTLFNLKSDYSILVVEKLQTTPSFIIYKITKK